MDIYSYINSKDIAEHCRNINHIFDPVEMSALVAFCDIAIQSKHDAWQEIIAGYPDMPIPASNGFEGCDSLHVYLRNFMAWENKFIAGFYMPGDDVVYRHRVIWDGHDRSGDGCYRTVEKALEDAGECYGWDCWKNMELIISLSTKKLLIQAADAVCTSTQIER